MEVFEDKGHRGDSAEPPSGSLCAKAGCSHLALEASAIDSASAGLCACCYRRSLEKRLSDAQTEAHLLPGRIARLPRDCQYAVRPEYERLLT